MITKCKAIIRRILVFFRDMRIAWKYTLAYFIILALPVILTGFYISRTTTDSITHQAGLVAKQSLLQKREAINRKIGDVERTSIAIAQHPQILNFLDATFLNNRAGYENYMYTIAPLFDNHIVQNKYIFHTLLYIRNETFPDAWNGIYHLDRAREDERIQALLADSGLSSWNPVHDSKLERSVSLPEKEKVLSLSRKMISFRDKTVIGVLEMEITVRELFESLEQEEGVDEYFVVFDAAGNLVSGKAVQALPPALKTGLLSLLAQEKDRSANIATIEAEKADKPTAVLIRDEVVTFDKEEYVVQSIPLEPLGATLVGITPLSSFLGNRAGYKQSIAWVIVFALILFAALIHFVSNHLTRRMDLLLDGMRSIRDGNINIKMPIGSRDEFGELAESFNLMTDRMHDLIERVYKSQITEKESALKALEAQINPHFLYNSLSTLSWMARKVKAENIDNLAFLISKFYRLVLSKGNSIISVEDEIELLKSYVSIEQIRFDDLFHVVYDLDESAFGCRMAKILLQPIAENAINHGIAPKGVPGTMVVRLRQDEQNLVFTIIDDGVGMDADILASIHRGEVVKRRESGYAIQNVRDRIGAIYGESGRITLFSRPGIGCTVQIVIPKTPNFLNF